MKTKTKAVESRETKVEGAPAVETRLEFVARACIQPSRTNPRKTFDNAYLKELAESIRIHGIKQPLLVRPLPKYELGEPDMMDDTWRISKEIDGGAREIVETFPNNKAGENAARMFMDEYSKHRFELVCGECRWRASELAELTTVPALVENLDDKAVLEIQLIENDQRKDLNVMERAEGYQKLRTELGYTEEDIIKKTGKGRSTVYEILSLLKASEPVRAAIASGKIPETVGRLLAKIPGEKNQAKALKEVVEGDERYDRDTNKFVKMPMSFRDALEHIRQEYQTDLKQAQFDREDETYAVPAHQPKAGAFKDAQTLPSCEKCPKRSGNCREEFPEIGNPNVCTDPECFNLKGKLHKDRIIAKAKEGGASEVLLGRQAENAFTWDDKPDMSAGYIGGSQQWPGMKKSVRDILKSNMPAPVVAIMGGKEKKIFKMADVEKALKDAGHNPKPIKKGEQRETLSYAEEQKKREEKIRQNKPLVEEATALLRTAAKEKLTTLELLRLLADDRSFYDMARRWGVKEKELEKRVAKMSEPELRAYLYERECLSSRMDYQGTIEKSFITECERFKIDLKKIGNELKLDDKPAGEQTTKTQTKTKGAKAKK